MTVSEDGRYFVDVYSTVTQPKTAVVRDDDGKVVMDVAKQDITKLVAAGWVAEVEEARVEPDRPRSRGRMLPFDLK